jgi:hypothetical protein
MPLKTPTNLSQSARKSQISSTGSPTRQFHQHHKPRPTKYSARTVDFTVCE